MEHFLLNEYRYLISRTVERYPCISFHSLDNPPDKFALLRHDIDMSPRNALELAKIEADFGVKATYTVLLTGEFYNPLELENLNIFRSIVSLGHDLGLHFDGSPKFMNNEEELEQKLRLEAEFLDNVLDLPNENKIKMFSFHNPSAFALSCRNFRYGGLVNAYGNYFCEKVAYTSDSNGMWRHQYWAELLEENHQRVQILTHPEWWGFRKHFVTTKGIAPYSD